MDNQKVLTIAYVVISLAVIVVLAVLLSRKKCKEDFRKCICSSEQGGRERNCQDTDTVNNLYVTNKLTEFSELKNQGWSTISPGDVDFPHSQGCNWCDHSSSEKGWKAWDFTDFGN